MWVCKLFCWIDVKFISLSFEWNSIRLGGHAHGIVTKTVHKTLPWGGGGLIRPCEY